MTSKKSQILIFTSLFLFAACATQPPEKQTGTRKSFPSSRYLTATGIGQTEGEARRQATAEMASIFESKIMSSTYSSALSVLDDMEGETFKKTVESKIRIHSSVQLKGVTIGETWQEDGRYHAIAVLDRFQAQENWSREKDALSAKMAGELNTLRATPSKVIRLAAANRVADLWLQQNVIRSRLSVIGFGGELDEEFDVRPVLKIISDIKSNISFQLDITGKKAPYVIRQIGKALTQKGFVLNNRGEDADVRVTGHISVAPVQLNNPDIHFVRADISLQVIDRNAAGQVGEVSENVRKGHINQNEASRKAVHAVALIAAERLIALIGIAETPAD